MADTDDTARRLAEIRARADALPPGNWVATGDLELAGVAYHVWLVAPDQTSTCIARVYHRDEPNHLHAEFIVRTHADIPYLLDLVAARDRELAELQGIFADLCEDSRAAERAIRAESLAMRYRRALRCIADGLTVDPVTGRLEPMTMEDARWVAKGQIEDRR